MGAGPVGRAVARRGLCRPVPARRPSRSVARPVGHRPRAAVRVGLSDRQAAEAVRCRIDFKYAPAMELDDPGFHHSVLADFRERIAQDDRADRLPDLALARLKEAGLVRERSAQRTDSTHVLAAVRDLTRLELVTEAVRAALEEVARTAGHLLSIWSTRSGGAATAVRSAWARTPPGPRAGSWPPATTPVGCWSASTGTDPATGPARRPRRCGGSSCRTTTVTRRAACAGGPPTTAGWRPRPRRSSPLTTPWRDTSVMGTSSAGRGSPRMSPRRVPPAAST
ncbi:transposase [Streptomyces canus]